MGYAVYDTARGPAGYGVEDTCHQDGCSAAIDRGLGYLCGSKPGHGDEHGCGWWFCADHLYSCRPGPGVTSLCGSCIEVDAMVDR